MHLVGHVLRNPDHVQVRFVKDHFQSLHHEVGPEVYHILHESGVVNHEYTEMLEATPLTQLPEGTIDGYFQHTIRLTHVSAVFFKTAGETLWVIRIVPPLHPFLEVTTIHDWEPMPLAGDEILGAANIGVVVLVRYLHDSPSPILDDVVTIAMFKHLFLKGGYHLEERTKVLAPSPGGSLDT